MVQKLAILLKAPFFCENNIFISFKLKNRLLRREFESSSMERTIFFFFIFVSPEDHYRVMAGEPLMFDKQLISLVKPTWVGDVGSVDFSKVAFWIHIYNVSIGPT